MPNKLYKFTFSPPARLAWLSAKIYKVPTEIINIDLSKAEQLDVDFLKINPKHEVPAFDHEGKYITESRTIAKYFHEHFNTDLEGNDHWYPSNPEKRVKVEEWLDWSDQRHMVFCKPPLLHATTSYGMPWRENYGIIMTIIGSRIKNDPGANAEMRSCLADAESMLSDRTIKEVTDLNLGDLAVFLESSLAFFVHPDIHYDNYPALKNLYTVIQKIPEFEEIDREFCEFTERVRDMRDHGPSPTVFTYINEMWATLKLDVYIIWNGIAFTGVKS